MFSTEDSEELKRLQHEAFFKTKDFAPLIPELEERIDRDG